MFLAAATAAGCLDGSSDKEDPYKPRPLTVEMLGGGSEMAYFDGLTGPVVVSASYYEYPRAQNCPSPLLGPNPVPDQWYVHIFNRTGWAKYYRWPITMPINDDEFAHELVLPPDPPYLIWADGTCGGFEVRVSAKAERAAYVRQVDPDNPTPPTGGSVPEVQALRTSIVPHTIPVPLGQMRGESAIHIDGVQDQIAIPILAGAVDWTPGAGNGKLSTYEPIQVPDGVNWMSQVQRGLVDNSFQDRQLETGMPGDYPLVLELDAPAPPNAQWEARPWISEILPNIADLGFDYPPKVWVDCRVQQCQLSGPPTP